VTGCAHAGVAGRSQLRTIAKQVRARETPAAVRHAQAAGTAVSRAGAPKRRDSARGAEDVAAQRCFAPKEVCVWVGGVGSTLRTSEHRVQQLTQHSGPGWVSGWPRPFATPQRPPGAGVVSCSTRPTGDRPARAAAGATSQSASTSATRPSTSPLMRGFHASGVLIDAGVCRNADAPSSTMAIFQQPRGRLGVSSGRPVPVEQPGLSSSLDPIGSIKPPAPRRL
jgi:hypothetical protein